MLCTTVRPNTECPFMAKEGCSYEGGVCNPIIDKCEGCARVIEFSSEKYCVSNPGPELKWKNGNCNLATHVVVEAKKKQKINPIKASKRGGM